MAVAVTAISRLLIGVGATLIGGTAYMKHQKNQNGSEQSTAAKVINALLSDNNNNTNTNQNQNNNHSQPQPPQLPPQPLNMTVHVPNPSKQSNWTWTIIFASFGLGATAILCM